MIAACRMAHRGHRSRSMLPSAFSQGRGNSIYIVAIEVACVTKSMLGVHDELSSQLCTQSAGMPSSQSAGMPMQIDVPVVHTVWRDAFRPVHTICRDAFLNADVPAVHTIWRDAFRPCTQSAGMLLSMQMSQPCTPMQMSQPCTQSSGMPSSMEMSQPCTQSARMPSSMQPCTHSSQMSQPCTQSAGMPATWMEMQQILQFDRSMQRAGATERILGRVASIFDG